MHLTTFASDLDEHVSAAHVRAPLLATEAAPTNPAVGARTPIFAKSRRKAKEKKAVAKAAARDGRSAILPPPLAPHALQAQKGLGAKGLEGKANGT